MCSRKGTRISGANPTAQRTRVCSQLGTLLSTCRVPIDEEPESTVSRRDRLASVNRESRFDPFGLARRSPNLRIAPSRTNAARQPRRSQFEFISGPLIWRIHRGNWGVAADKFDQTVRLTRREKSRRFHIDENRTAQFNRQRGAIAPLAGTDELIQDSTQRPSKKL